MALNLKKLCDSPLLLEAIADLVKSLGTSIVIQDTKGRVILGDDNNKAGDSASAPLRDRLPIEIDGEVIGWAIGEAKVAPIASIISCFAQKELEKKTLAHEVLDNYREITFLYDLSAKLTASLDIDELVNLLLAKAKGLIKATSGAVMLLSNTNNTEELKVVSAFGQEWNRDRRTIPWGESIVGLVVKNGLGEIVNDVANDRRCMDFEATMSALICIPLVSKGRPIGAIALGNSSPVTYTAADLKRMNTLASQAAAAIDNAQLYQESCIAATTAQLQAEKLQQALRELQETQAQLIQSEKMSSLGQLVAGVAHEINNPINFISGNICHAQQYTEELLKILQIYQQEFPNLTPALEAAIAEIDLEFLSEDFPKLISSMKMGTDRIQEIVLSLRNFSRLDEAQTKPVDLHSGIDSTLMILHHRLKAQPGRPNIQVIKNYGDLPLVECHAGLMNQVFMNILSNAIDALEEQKKSGEIVITTELLPHKPRLLATTGEPMSYDGNESIVIKIRDNGCGIPEEICSRLFDPFFTTKPVGKGTGLGLSISYKIIVEKHGGIIKCLSQTGLGTEFYIQIPLKLSIELGKNSAHFSSSAKRLNQHLESPNCFGTLPVNY
jgi:signal transduction histidine kinase